MSKPPRKLLTESAVRNARATEKPRKLFDERGLYLLVNPNGSRWWRLKYRHGGTEKLISLGTYPDVSLKRAREKCGEARALVADGTDPSAKRKAKKQAARVAKENTFAAVAEEWFAHYREHRAKGKKPKPLAPATIVKTQWLLNLEEYRGKEGNEAAQHPLKPISDRAIRDIAKEDIGSVLRGLVKQNKIETAHRMLDRLDRVFRYAVGTDRIERNPAAAFRDSPDPRDKLPPLEVRNHPAITEPRAVGELLRAIDGYSGQPATQAAMKLAPLVFVRPGELRGAQWSEFDLDGAEPTWRIPEARTKMRREHIVPLAPQAVVILRELHALTGPDGLVFPSLTNANRPLSENAITAALRRMGYSGDQMTWHGFRTIASTLLNEQGWSPDLIELQLAHVDSTVRGDYNKAKRLPERRRMMQQWASYLDQLRSGAKVVPIGRRAG